jgi:hypothetical protein
MIRYITIVAFAICQNFIVQFCFSAAPSSYEDWVIQHSSRQPPSYQSPKTYGINVLPVCLQSMVDPYIGNFPEQWASIFLETTYCGFVADIEKGKPFNEQYWLFFVHKLSRVIEDRPGWIEKVGQVPEDLAYRLSYYIPAIMNFYNLIINDKVLDLFLYNPIAYLPRMKNFIGKVCYSRVYSFEEKQRRYKFSLDLLQTYSPFCSLFIDIIYTLSADHRLSEDWLLYLKEYFDVLNEEHALTREWVKNVRNILRDFKETGGHVSHPIILIQQLFPRVPFCGASSNEQVENQLNLPSNDTITENSSLFIQSIIADEENARQTYVSIEHTERVYILKKMMSGIRLDTSKAEKHQRRKLRAHYLHVFFKVPQALADLQEVEEVSYRQKIEEEFEDACANAYHKFLASMGAIKIRENLMKQVIKNEDISRKALEENYWNKIVGEFSWHLFRLRDALDTEFLDSVAQCSRVSNTLIFLTENSSESIAYDEDKNRKEIIESYMKGLLLLSKKELVIREFLLRKSIVSEGESVEKLFAPQAKDLSRFMENEIARGLVIKPLESPMCEWLIKQPILALATSEFYGAWYAFIKNNQQNKNPFDIARKRRALLEEARLKGRAQTYAVLFALSDLADQNNLYLTAGKKPPQPTFFLAKLQRFKVELTQDLNEETSLWWQMKYCERMLDIGRAMLERGLIKRPGFNGEIECIQKERLIILTRLSKLGWTLIS